MTCLNQLETANVSPKLNSHMQQQYKIIGSLKVYGKQGKDLTLIHNKAMPFKL